ncbi:MAG: RNase adapter RapZ [Acidobacteria bacterium]|nr:RNase adapter RapZ [Acidobacteriota bacterium]MBI3426826.1 RNase adapter RapZ [Acidobacteriota bacterium]
MTPQLIIITGLSGSGMSSAMNVFEDLGYFCVDNLPVELIPSFVNLFKHKESNITRAALGVNIREGRFLDSFPQVYSQLHGRNDLELTVVFLEASDAALQRRYSETRRPHPLGEGRVLEAIQEEREKLAPIRGLADVVVDTSDHNVHSLRAFLKKRFTPENTEAEMELNVLSFGYKYGVPLDADLLFDVRFLPNPYFVPELRELTGNDQPVIEYLQNTEDARETINRFSGLLDYLMPLYKREGKSYVTIGVGCTGGKHRSVAVANALGQHLNQTGYHARVMHRDVKK